MVPRRLVLLRGNAWARAPLAPPLRHDARAALPARVGRVDGGAPAQAPVEDAHGAGGNGAGPSHDLAAMGGGGRAAWRQPTPAVRRTAARSRSRPRGGPLQVERGARGRGPSLTAQPASVHLYGCAARGSHLRRVERPAAPATAARGARAARARAARSGAPPPWRGRVATGRSAMRECVGAVCIASAGRRGGGSPRGCARLPREPARPLAARGSAARGRRGRESPLDPSAVEWLATGSRGS